MKGQQGFGDDSARINTDFSVDVNETAVNFCDEQCQFETEATWSLWIEVGQDRGHLVFGLRRTGWRPSGRYGNKEDSAEAHMVALERGRAESEV